MNEHERSNKINFKKGKINYGADWKFNFMIGKKACKKINWLDPKQSDRKGLKLTKTKSDQLPLGLFKENLNVKMCSTCCPIFLAY